MQFRHPLDHAEKMVANALVFDHRINRAKCNPTTENCHLQATWLNNLFTLVCYFSTLIFRTKRRIQLRTTQPITIVLSTADQTEVY
jgi:hypothetical protein